MAEDVPSLLDDIRAAARPIGPRCTVLIVSRELSQEDRTGLTTAIADGTIPASVIGAALRRRGHKIGDDSVRRHRTHKCGCDQG